METSNSSSKMIRLAAVNGLIVLALLAAALPRLNGLDFSALQFHGSNASPAANLPNESQGEALPEPAAAAAPTVGVPGCPEGDKHCAAAALQVLVQDYRPEEVPAHVTDFHLLGAWLHLYNSQAGRQFAEFIRDERIPLAWGEDMGNICGKIAKTVDASGRWMIEPGTPIKINASLANSGSIMLATVIAHEAFHYTQPFGQVASSLYEEFQAMALEDTIWRESNAQMVPTPQIYDPYKETDLLHFFAEHGELTGSQYYAQYRQGTLAMYPASWEDQRQGR